MGYKPVYDKLTNKILLHSHDPLVLKDSNGVFWNITVNTDGTLSSVAQSTNAGAIIGFPFGITYSS